MVRIGLHKGNSLLKSLLYLMYPVKYPKVKVHYFFFQKSLKMYVTMDVDSMLKDLCRTWFGSSVQHNCQSQYISQPPTWDSI